MKLKDTNVNTIIETVNDFCTKAGIKLSDNQELIATTMQEINHSVYFEVMVKAFNEYIRGKMDIKAPYKINNLFISQVIKTYFSLIYTGEPESDKPDYIPTHEEINRIFEIGIVESKERLKSFLKKENKYFDAFFLFNEYQWLTDNKGLDIGKFDDDKIETFAIRFKRYDDFVETDKIITNSMTMTEYRYAAVVALYFLQS